MSNNIEKDIEIVEKLLKHYEKLDYRFNNMLGFEETKAIENILADRERLEKENINLKVYIATAPNLDEMTATKYINMQNEGYLRGRAEERQKAKQIINEKYIPKQVIKDKIKEIQEKLKNKNLDWQDCAKYLGVDEILKELLQEDK